MFELALPEICLVAFFRSVEEVFTGTLHLSWQETRKSICSGYWLQENKREILMAESASKKCFVISPIGETNSDTRVRSDQVLRHIIRPAVEPSYNAVRADEIAEPGMITSQIMQRVIEDDLVIADLTDLNPNVLYELAVRHAILKPFVQIIAQGQNIPFDVHGTRTVFFDLQNPDSVSDAKEEIQRQVATLENESPNLQTPISIPLELQRIRQSAGADNFSISEVLPVISDIANTTTANRSDIQYIVRSLSEDGTITRSRRPNRSLGYYMDQAFRSDSPHGFLLALGYFQGRDQGVYEIGLEAYRQATLGNAGVARELFDLLVGLCRERPVGRMRGDILTEAIEPMVELFERLLSRIEYDSRGSSGYRF